MEYLNSFVKFGTKLGLTNISYLMEKLENPHQKLNCIHIAGTNGKGSVAAILSSVLIQAGYKVGLYTSPHLIDLRERVKINRNPITKREFIQKIDEIKNIIEAEKTFTPTFFEIITAIALNYFVLKRVDFTILEVGMGGRLDATNITKPLVSIITNIDLDHTQHLGKSKAKILEEKIAIIKEKGIVVTAIQDKNLLNRIKSFCREKKAKLLIVGSDITPYDLSQKNINYQTASFEGRIQRYENIKIPLLGDHQIQNTATAIATMECLQILGAAELTIQDIQQGIFKTEWDGRFQIINTKNTNYIIDCAHNQAGVTSFLKTLKLYFPNRKFTFIITFSKDKNIEKILKLLIPYAKEFIFPNIPDNLRIIRKNNLAAICQKITSDIKITKVKDVEKAIAHCKKREMVCITGSIFLVGEALKILKPETGKNEI